MAQRGAKGGQSAQKPSAAGGCVALVVLVAVVAGIIAIASGSGGSSSPAKDAASYIGAHGDDASRVQAAMEDALTAVGIAAKSPTTANVNQVAQVAQQAHDTIDSVRDNFATTDTSGTVGNAEVEVFTAANDLKNAMGALVAYTGNPNPATLAHFNTQYQNAKQEWNQGVDTIWNVANRNPAPSIP